MTLFTITTAAVHLTWRGPRAEATGPFALTVQPLAPSVMPSVEIHAEAGSHLMEETAYTVFAQAHESAALRLHHADPVLLSGLHDGQDGRVLHGAINFGSQIGRSRFTLSVDGRPHLAFDVEVAPTKLDYRADYDALCADLHEIAHELAVDYLQAAYQPAAAQAGATGPLAWTLLLRHRMHDLEQALAHVAAYPQWSTDRQEALRPVEQIHRPDAAVRRSVAQGRGAGPWQASTLGVPIRARLPARPARYTLDTPEHRWLRLMTEQVGQHLAAWQAAEGRLAPTKRRRQMLADLAALQRRAARLLHQPPLREATRVAYPPAPSVRLLTAPGYREAYQALLALRQGLEMRGGPFPLHLKDLHLLYEYWCFLTLVRLVAERAPSSLPIERLLAPERYGLRLRLRKGHACALRFDLSDGRHLVLTYNPRFGGAGYLVPQQPDLLLTVHRPDGKRAAYVLDAKYRLDDAPGYRRRYGMPGPPTEALNTLHRYRDAILDQPTRRERTVVQALALFPYREAEPGTFAASRLYRSIDEVGVGAIPLLPGATDHLRAWLDGVLTS